MNHPQHDNPASQVLYNVTSRPINPLEVVTVKVTPSLLMFEKGKISTRSQQIPMAFVQDVDASQSMIQRGRGVGSVIIHVARPHGIETVRLDDIPEHHQLVACLNDVSRNARLHEQRLRNTHNYQGNAPFAQQPPMSQATPPPPAPVPAAPATPTADEIISQIGRLGELRDAGILSDDEFQAKKTDLLGRL